MDCINCGAPLPPDSDLCEYCGSLNDTDLRRLYGAHVDEQAATEEHCPRCPDTTLFSLVVDLPPKYLVHRCGKCLGMLFDPGELDAFVDTASKIQEEPDSRRLAKIEDASGSSWPIRYIPCPVCGELMQRRDFSHSGVIMNTCRDHGAWLDGGELGQILRWTRAGGLKAAARTEAEERALPQISSVGPEPFEFDPSPPATGGLLGLIASLLTN